jgi:hypothetical protein
MTRAQLAAPSVPDSPRDPRTAMSRRRLLRGLGAATAVLTTPVWRAATAFGRDVRAAKRFIGIFSANGTVPTAFFPALPRDTTEAPLTLGPILAPLEKWKAKLLVLRGVHMSSTIGPNKPGGPHMKGPGAMLTGGWLLPGSFTGAGGPAGYANRISVDQLIANRVGSATRFPSLELGVRIQGQEPLRVISYRGSNQPNNPVDDPWAVYKRVFSTGELSSAALTQLIAERKGVLDFLRDDLGRLRARLGAEDRGRLDAHLEGIQRIERQLTAGATVSCQAPMLPARIDPRAMANFPTIGRLQTDLMVLALACGLTRVATFMWANADSWQYFPWIGVNEEHHHLSHASDSDAAAREKLVKINVWHTEQVAYLMDRLAEIPEPGGTLLDSTLILWGNEIGVGNTHTYKDIPWVLAGGAAGYFKMGRYLRYADTPHNNLLLSVCHAMGFDDVKTFGAEEYCTGPLGGLVAP